MHVFPQLPQFWSLLATQTPLQSKASLLQTQLPATHFAKEPQRLPQAPQFWLSPWRSRQAPWQGAFPVGQAQTPPAQVVPPVQCLPQAPQFCGSPWRSVQEVPQGALPAGQAETQVLSEQSSPGRHLPPQLPAQSPGLSQTHLPPWQRDPGPQATWQAPQ